MPSSPDQSFAKLVRYLQDVSNRPGPHDLRASDADRDLVITMLSEAAGDGRLTLSEHAERSEQALTARTLGELVRLTSDLSLAVGPADPALPASLGDSTVRPRATPGPMGRARLLPGHRVLRRRSARPARRHLPESPRDHPRHRRRRPVRLIVPEGIAARDARPRDPGHQKRPRRQGLPRLDQGPRASPADMHHRGPHHHNRRLSQGCSSPPAPPSPGSPPSARLVRND